MSEPKKVLIITYYWPPSGGSGVQRWLHFSKYLKRLGWEPIIYTPENPEAPVNDPKLLKETDDSIEVIRTPIWEPLNIYKRITGQKNRKIQVGFLQEGPKNKTSSVHTMSLWIRANFFIPDAKKFWIKPSIRFLLNYLKENPVNVIVSTGPPHTTHLIALGVHRKIKTPWLADFRDPWTNIDWFDKLPMTAKTIAKHKSLEMEVLSEADALSCVSETWSNEFSAMCGREVHLITNGFAPSDFDQFKKKKDPGFTILHTGSLNADRNPKVFWEILGETVKKDLWLNQNLKIKLIGAVDHEVITSLSSAGLSNHLQTSPFVPHHEVIEAMESCSVLLLPINNAKNQGGIIPGKLFEYLASNQCIVAIGPKDGDSARILVNQQGVIVLGFNEKPDLEKIKSMAQTVINRNDQLNPYSREQLAKAMNSLLLQIST